MAKIGMTMSRNRVEEPIAQHFGKAKWLLVYDTEGPPRFIPNEGLNGHWVARQFAAAGVAAVVATHLGPGALAYLRAARIPVLAGSPSASAAALAKEAAEGKLQALSEAALEGGGHGHGCGCHHH